MISTIATDSKFLKSIAILNSCLMDFNFKKSRITRNGGKMKVSLIEAISFENFRKKAYKQVIVCEFCSLFLVFVLYM